MAGVDGGNHMRPQWLARFSLFLLAAGVIYGLMLATTGAVPARYQERTSADQRSFPPIHSSEVNRHELADDVWRQQS